MVKAKNEKHLNKILVFLLIFIMLLNSAWIIKNREPPKGSGLNLVSRSIYLSRDIQNNNFEKLSRDLFRTNDEQTDTPFPPLLLFSYTLFFIIFGISEKVLFVNLIYLVILLFSVFKLGQYLYDKKKGLLAVIILNSFFIIQLVVRRTDPMFHLLSFITLDYWLLLKTNYFKNTKFVLLFALSLGLTTLVHYTFIPFIIPQLVIYFIYSLLKNYNLKKGFVKLIDDRKNILFNFLFIVIIASLISFIWYNPSYNVTIQSLQTRIETPSSHDNFGFSIFSFENIFYYIDGLINFNLGLIYFIILVFSYGFLLFKIWKRKSSFEEIFIMFSFIFPYLYLTFLIPIKGFFLFIPAIFPFGIIISNFILNLKKKDVKIVVLVFILIYSIYFHIAPFQNELPKLFYRINTHALSIEGLEYLGQHDLRYREAPYHREVILYINENALKNNITKPKVVFLSETDNLPFFYVQYYIEKNNLDLSYVMEYTEDISDWKYQNIKTYQMHVNKNITRYVLTKHPDYVVVKVPLMEKYSYLSNTSYHLKNSELFTNYYTKLRTFEAYNNHYFPYTEMQIELYRRSN